MPNIAAGMRVRLYRINEEENEEILSALPVYLTVEGLYRSVTFPDEGPSWFCRMDPESFLGKTLGSRGMNGYEGVFGCFFFENEIEPVGPPETTRQMSYHILLQLK